MEKARIVEKVLRPGGVVAVVARQHDVHANLLPYWQRQARQATNRRITFLSVSVSTEERSSGRG